MIMAHLSPFFAPGGRLRSGPGGLQKWGVSGVFVRGFWKKGFSVAGRDSFQGEKMGRKEKGEGGRIEKGKVECGKGRTRGSVGRRRKGETRTYGSIVKTNSTRFSSIVKG